MDGDLLAWGHDAWRTWHDWEIQIVRMVTRSVHCHVGVAHWHADRLFVIEAVVPKVRMVELSSLLPCYWLGGDGPRVAWSEDIEKRALSLIGAPYSKWEAIKAVIGRVIPGANGVWQCAEAAAYIRGMLLMTSWENPTPSSLVKDAMERGARQELLTN